MRGNTYWRAVLALAMSVAILGIAATSAHADVTTYIGASGSGGTDKWNVTGNWNNGVPSGAIDAVIPNKTSAFTVAVTSSTVPVYSGDLTIGNNVTLQLGYVNGSQFAACYNALGTPGLTTIYMGNNSMIKNRNYRGGANWTVPAVVLNGNATFKLKESTEGATNPTFAYPVTGNYTLTIDQPGTCTFKAANSFSALIASNGPTVVASAAGALGTGNVSIMGSSALTIGAVAAMDDTATLSLGTGTVTMNANDTVAGLVVNGTPMAPGTYTTASGSWITGSGTLTVTPPRYWAAAGGETPNGTWSAADTNWNDAADGSGTSAGWTSGDLSAGQTAVFAAGTGATGAYTVTVDGTQTFAGMVFEDGAATLTGGTALQMIADSSVKVAAGKTATIQTPITQDGTNRQLVKTGDGVLVLSGSNTYGGTTTVATGILRLGASDVLPDGKSVAVTGGTLDLNGNSDTIGSLTLGGSTNGGASVTTGAGMLTLGGNVTYANTGNPLGATIAGKLDLGAATRTFTVNDSTTAANDLTVSADISGTGFGLTKAGAGTMVLSGNNTYTGLTTVSAGTLTVSGSGTLGNGAPLTMSGGSINLGGTSQTVGAVSITAPAASGDTIGSGDLTGTSYAASNTTGTAVISANLLGSGVTMTKSGAGTLALSGSNTYTGNTLISAGTLRIDNKLALQNSVMDTSGAGVMNLNAGPDAYTFGGLVGSKDLASVITTGLGDMTTLILNPQSGSEVTYSGVIANGAMAVTKTGAGTQVLSGTNTYTGKTTVSGGLLVATTASAIGATNADLEIADGATFVYRPAAAGALARGTGVLTFNDGATVGAALGGTAGESAIASSAAAVASSGTVTVDIRGIPGVAVTAGPNDLITADSGLDGGANFVLGKVYNNADFTVSPLSTSATSVSTTVTSVTPLTTAYWTGGLTGATNVWARSDGSTAGNWADSAGGAAQALVPGSGADVVISATSPTIAPTATVLGANMIIKTLTISDAANGLGLGADTYTLTITPTDPGTGITMADSVPASEIAADVALGAAQTWTNNSASPLTVSGAVDNGGFLLTVKGAGSVAASGVISGSGGITVDDAAATLTLSGNNTYTGTTTVSAGTLKLGAAGDATNAPLGTVAAGTAVSATGAALDLNGFTLGTAEALSITGTGIGSAGALTNSGDAATYKGVVTIAAAGTSIGGTGDITLSAALANTANSLVKVGDNKLTFKAASSRTGATQIDAGTLRIENATAMGTLGATVNAGALEIGNVTLDKALSLNNGATLSGTGASARSNGVMTVAGGASVTFSAVGAADVLTLANGDNDLTGGNASTTLNIGGAGIVLLSGDTSPTHSITGTWVVGSGATLRIERGTDALLGNTANDVTLNGGAFSLTANSDYNPGSGRVFTMGTGGGTINVGSGRIITFDDVNQLTGDGSLTKSGAGTVIISNTQDYAGGTTINAGMLTAYTTGALPGYSTSGKVIVDGGTLAVRTLDSGWTTGEVDTLLSNATKTSGALGIDTTNDNLTQWTAFTNDNLGPLGLVKLGANALTLDQANTHSGGTTLVAGQLSINAQGTDSSNSAIGTGPLTINGGTIDATNGAIDLTGTTNNAVTIGGNFTFGGTNALNIGTGAVTNTGNRTITLNGNNPLTLGAMTNTQNAATTLTVNNGTGTGGNTALILGSYALTGGSNTAVRTTTIAGSGNVTISGEVSNGQAYANALSYTGTGTLTLSGANTYSGTTTMNNATGTLRLSGSNSSNGTTTLTAGTLQIGANNALAGGSLALNGGTIMAYGATRSISNNVSSWGNFTFGGTQDLTISGTTTTGTTARTVTISNTGTTTLGAVTYGADHTFNFSDGSGNLVMGDLPLTAARQFTVGATGTAGSLVLGGVVSGNYALTKAGTGTMVLAGINTYTGDTTVSAGTLELAQTGSLKFVIGADGVNDQITGAGEVSLAGEFIFDLTTVPAGTAVNDKWRIVDTDSLASAIFSTTFSVNGFDPVGSDKWTMDIPSSTNKYEFSELDGWLRVVAGIVPGDTNEDFVVDAFDFITLKKNFGTTSGAGVSAGDFNGSGTVNWTDLNILTNSMAGSGGALIVTPEPATLGLLMVGALVVLRRRRS